jgi:hypothetical protein
MIALVALVVAPSSPPDAVLIPIGLLALAALADDEPLAAPGHEA